MPDFALAAAVALLMVACLVSARVALNVWLPDRRERARIRAERVEHMLREVGHVEMVEDTM